MSEDYEDEEFEEPEPLELYIKDGKLVKWEGVQIEKKSFEIMKKGMAKLKKKYPEIAKECFGG